MSKQKWFRNKNFIVTLLGVIGVALVAAAKEVARICGLRHYDEKGGSPE
ncbi:hypothetical protein LCGC14_0613210 [marine sediment metagenome]|uniref:Uncharacterized protein n=1 Tax=marine sediment metagenome TaxID=412755 RepID=A0A0F9RBX6_9ZZZZ